MFKILIDTCVWLDLAKDYRQKVILSALEELIQQGDIGLILPRTIVEEFTRNKARIIEESSRSLSSALKRAKEAMETLGDPQQRDIVLTQLNNVDQRLPSMGEAAVDTVERIEKIFSSTPIVEITDPVKLRAAQRAIENRAPFHRPRNGINDAILIEVYTEAIKEKGNRFAFISHNIKDFSHPHDNKKLPHPDIAVCFSRIKSLYFITLRDALQRISPEQFTDLMFELEWIEEPRRVSEIVEAIDELFHKVWYNRHQVAREKIDEGITKIVEKETFPIKDHRTRPVQRDVWGKALIAAAKVEKKFGLENLGPWDDFEWGMINGKLSALRWVLGDEWDMLDT